MKSWLPKILISLNQIEHNARQLCELYGSKGISIMGVSKAVLGDPFIAKAMIRGGIKYLADSRLENIQKMRNAGIICQFVLLRTALSQAELVVATVDISLNTELITIERLAYYAKLQNKIHNIILMVELGDLREGILPEDLLSFIRQVLSLSSIKIVGIGCNLACYGGIKPDENKMRSLSELANLVEREFGLNLMLISGGNSANYQWYQEVEEIGRINNLRLGESILLGCDTITREPIPGLYTSAFNLIAEVIESKEKPSLPFGEVCQDAFGHTPVFVDQGIHRRVIIALGRQDVLVSGLQLNKPMKILGSSSDHLIIDAGYTQVKVGSEVNFHLDYGGLLSAMSSRFIYKNYILNDYSDNLLSKVKILPASCPLPSPHDSLVTWIGSGIT